MYATFVTGRFSIFLISTVQWLNVYVRVIRLQDFLVGLSGACTRHCTNLAHADAVSPSTALDRQMLDRAVRRFVGSHAVQQRAVEQCSANTRAQHPPQRVR